MKNIIIAFLLTIIPAAIFGVDNSNYPNGQQNDPSPNTYNENNFGAKLFFTGGAHFINMSEINAALASTSFPALPQEYATLGFTYQTTTSRFINETDFEWLLKRTTMNDIYHSSYWSFYFTSDVGYMIIQSKHVDLFPMIGLGYAKQNIALVEYTGPSFQDFLFATPTNLRLESSAFIMNFGLGIDFKIGDSGSSPVAFVLGIRGGYCYQASITKWNASEVELPDSPDSRMSGFYVKLMIGFGETTEN